MSGQWGFGEWVSTSNVEWGPSDWHFQCRVEGFRREKKGKLFYFSNTKGSNIGEEGGFYCGGFRRARRTFPVRAQAEGGGVPAGSRVGFARVVGVLLTGLFRRGDREGSNGVVGRVSTKKKSFSNGVAFQGGWGSHRRGTTTMEEKN